MAVPTYRDTAYAITVRLATTPAPAQTVQIASNTRMRIGERIGLEIRLRPSALGVSSPDRGSPFQRERQTMLKTTGSVR